MNKILSIFTFDAPAHHFENFKRRYPSFEVLKFEDNSTIESHWSAPTPRKFLFDTSNILSKKIILA